MVWKMTIVKKRANEILISLYRIDVSRQFLLVEVKLVMGYMQRIK